MCLALQSAARKHGVACEIDILGSAPSREHPQLTEFLRNLYYEKLTLVRPTSFASTEFPASEDAAHMMDRVKSHGGQASFLLFQHASPPDCIIPILISQWNCSLCRYCGIYVRSLFVYASISAAGSCSSIHSSRSSWASAAQVSERSLLCFVLFRIGNSCYFHKRFKETPKDYRKKVLLKAKRYLLPRRRYLPLLSR